MAFLPGKAHGQRNVAGYGPWGCRVRHDLVSDPPPTINRVGYDICCDHTCWSFRNGAVAHSWAHWFLNACVFLRPWVFCALARSPLRMTSRTHSMPANQFLLGLFLFFCLNHVKYIKYISKPK